ncbi:MAG: hypothetical protein NUV93_09805 [Firmicutes bacterium]|nr:hypothetical protein [Bacillota bacterium]
MLERIAQAIRDDPSATAKDIARRLGYSEEKSIYYWLEKGQFKGLREFRHAVLTGRFPSRGYIVGETARSAREGEAAYSLHEVPLVSSLSDAGRPILSGSTVSSLFRASRDTFGFLLGVSEYAPVLEQGDTLVVDPARPASDGDLVLVQWEGAPRIVRHYAADGRLVLVHPSRPSRSTAVPREAVRIIGTVVGLVRRFARDG